jgi:hypothetical protein
MQYSGKAWKHHIADDFENDLSLCFQNGVGAGGTIFLDYSKMIDYLQKDGGKWYVAELDLFNTPISFDFGNDYMATILVSCLSNTGFIPCR